MAFYTDMNAIRSDEELGNPHSLYVDQWDWERVITDEDRNIHFLKRNRKPYLCGHDSHRIYGIRNVSPN